MDLDSELSKYRKPKGWGTRHTLALMGFWGFVISYSIRFNLSIAIVAMVNSTKSQPLEIGGPEEIVFQSDVCLKNSLNQPYRNNTQNEMSDEELESWSIPGEFNWNEAEQGLILASFFWGYILTQLPGGWLGHRFGGKWPLGIGILVASLFALLTPLAARTGKEYLIVVRIIQGLGEGVSMPCMHTVLAKWIPPEERGKLSAIVYAGMPFGTAMTTLISGYIIHYWGWAIVFYASGIMGILWFLCWVYFVFSIPTDHPRICQDELKFIQNSIGDQSSEKKMKVPWKKVVKSVPFWSILIGQATETWGLYTIMTELPTYMNSVLHFDMRDNSLVSAFPHLLTWGVSIVLTQTGDFLIEKKIITIVNSRKICNTIALWGSAAALIGVAYSGCDRGVTVALIGLSVASMGGIYGGVLINLIDIAPNFAGLLMGFTNTMATIPGFAAPWVAGAIINQNPSLERWRIVFLITSAVSFIGNLIFILFASGEEQSWNREEEDAPVDNIDFYRDNRERVVPQHLELVAVDRSSVLVRTSA